MSTPQNKAAKAVLRGCHNQRATEVFECEPQKFIPNLPPAVEHDKAAFGLWAQELTTKHLFFLASEGCNPLARPSASNSIRFLHGLIADFDAENITAETIESALARCGDAPNWTSRTFSNGARLVWMFQEPVAMENEQLAREFLKVAAQRLRLKKLLPGWDESAWYDLKKIYEVGREWNQIVATPLTKETVHAMLEEASRKTKWDKDFSLIPIEIVADEVERQYAGRWEGPFEIGSRGVCFFDPNSTNPTSSIVTEAGMVTFSQEKIFYSWAEILGQSFVKKYNDDRIGGAAADTWYDGNRYWLKNDKGVWKPHSKDDYRIRLKVRHKLHNTNSRMETHSEVERAMMFVQENRRVDGAAPRVYSEDDILYVNGKRLINSAAVKAMQPAGEPQLWGDNFPWLADFLDTCWDSKAVACVEGGHPASAKEIFLAWFRRYYRSAIAGNLLKGHVLFLVGPTDCGKTLLSNRIVGDAMGGLSDASDFLQGNSCFNAELLECALWTLDDAIAATDPQSHQKFSEMIKRCAANPFFGYHKKYIDSQRVEWNGRVIVTLNDTPQSLRIIPNVDSSLEDKIVVLRFNDSARTFPTKHELEATILNELPYLLRWLVDTETSVDVTGGNRFGIKAYIHEDTRVSALHSGGLSDIMELVELWIKRSAPQERHGSTWKGTATEWIAEAAADETLEADCQ